MSLYDLLMAPIERRVLIGMRRELIGRASGDVLELGAKTGANFAYYRLNQLQSLVVSDLALDRSIHRNAPEMAIFRECSALSLPFADSSFDTVVETLVFCSVEDLAQAVREVYRVLRPGGRLLYLDHGLPTAPVLAGLFRWLNLLWPHLTGGCNLDRNVRQQIAGHGFRHELLRHDNSGIFTCGVASKPGLPLRP